MKIYNLVLLAIGLTLLQGCDSQETKVKKLLKCGLAVNEIGNQQARANYDKNGVATIFGSSPPNISSYDMVRIGGDAREELWLNGRNSRGAAEKIIDEYEESYCVEIHQTPKDENIERLKKYINKSSFW